MEVQDIVARGTFALANNCLDFDIVGQPQSFDANFQSHMNQLQLLESTQQASSLLS